MYPNVLKMWQFRVFDELIYDMTSVVIRHEAQNMAQNVRFVEIWARIWDLTMSPCMSHTISMTISKAIDKMEQLLVVAHFNCFLDHMCSFLVQFYWNRIYIYGEWEWTVKRCTLNMRAFLISAPFFALKRNNNNHKIRRGIIYFVYSVHCLFLCMFFSRSHSFSAW